MASVALVNSNFNSTAAQQAEEQQKAKISHWADVALTVSVVAVGALFSSSFALGLCVGVLNHIAERIVITALVVFRCVQLKKEAGSDYVKFSNQLTLWEGAIEGPVIEEVLFRGIAQGGIRFAAKMLWPLKTVRFMIGPPMALASVISVVVSAALFGAVHLSNKHPNAKIQSALCFSSGLIYGALNVNYGLAAPIGAHIANNLIIRKHKFFMKAPT